MKVTLTVPQFTSLHKADPTLYAYLLPAASGGADKPIEIDESKIPAGPLHGQAFDKLKAWATEDGIKVTNPPHPYDGCSECFQKHMSEELSEERQAEYKRKAAAKKSLEAALARLQDYFQAGLVDSSENAEIFDRTWREHPQLSKITQPSPEILDAVIAICRDKLAGRKPTPVVTTQPEEPVILSDGKPQLPIDTVLSNRYTVVQLRDLDRRRRARDAGESESLPPLPSGKPRLPFGTKPNPAKHSADQIRDLESRTARVWARQTGSHGASWFSSDSQVI